MNNSKQLLPCPKVGEQREGMVFFRSTIWGYPEETEPQDGCLVMLEPQGRHSHYARPHIRCRDGGHTWLLPPSCPLASHLGLPLDQCLKVKVTCSAGCLSRCPDVVPLWMPTKP